MRRGCDPRKNIARDQAQRDAVRVGYDDRIVDLQAKRRSSRPACLNCTVNVRCFHAVLPQSRIEKALQHTRRCAVQHVLVILRPRRCAGGDSPHTAGREVDQFEFGCAPRVAPDTTVSPRQPLLRIYRPPVRGHSIFGGRSGLSGRKRVKYGALSSARPRSSAIFPEPTAPGNAELSQEACASLRTQHSRTSVAGVIRRMSS